MKKNLIVGIMVSLILLAVNSQAKSVKWVYQGAIDTSNGLALSPTERLIRVAADSRGVVYYGTYQNQAGRGDIHIYKLVNVLDPGTRAASILHTVSDISVWNQYYGLTCDTADNVYFSYYYDIGAFGGETAICKYDKDGNVVTSFGTNGKVSPPVMDGLSFRAGGLCYVPASNKIVLSGISPNPNVQYTSRLVGIDAATGIGIDTSYGASTSGGSIRFIRGLTYDAANNNFLTLNSIGLLERWSGGTPSDLTGYAIDSVLMNYNSMYGVRLQLGFDGEYRQTFASVSSAVPERYFISVYDLDSGVETQRLTADSTVGPTGWCSGSCTIGSGNNKRLIAIDFVASKLHIYAPELPQLVPSGSLTISIGINRELTASLGTKPYTWSINTISGSPGTLSAVSGDSVTFISTGVGSCVVRCTDANGLYAEVTINVVPTVAPLYPDTPEFNRVRLEE
ncbi:MAG: hypothetical protein N3A72_01190 [bacterium]|nr:hypothetical protein [bacterium]